METPNMQHEQATAHVSYKETRELLQELKVDHLANQFSNRVITLVIASLGLTTALAWDETLRGIFHALLGSTDTLTDKLLYSVLVTLVAVIITIILARSLNGKKKALE
jgi:hypothetical protein